MWSIVFKYGGRSKSLSSRNGHSQPKKLFSQTFAISTKNFGRKQELDNGHLRAWATIKTHSVAAVHSHAVFCFSRWSLLTFSGQFWHFHTETKGSPASCLSGNKT